ncbi:MAG: 2-oxo acid dehydrogenase subunit E2 [Armatimonadetes bacterium]|nr:2-oxo acid dehydrogenase subunit E2 [Armatimonadota bacterium]
MAYEFKLPDIGEGTIEGEIVAWHVKEGDTIREDDAMVDVMTDKATVTIPSPRSGKISRIMAREGETVKVGAVLIVIESAEEAAAPPSEEKPVEAAAPPSRPAEERRVGRVEAVSVHPRGGDGGGVSTAVRAPGERILATPVTRQIAREQGIDLSRVPGTGPGGRVTKEDVLAFTEKGAPPQTAPPTRPEPATPGPLEERVPIRGLRKRIAEKMSLSKQHAPHFTYVEECDFTALVELRKKAETHPRAEGLKITYLPFIIKALVPCFKAHPYLNSSLDEKTQEIVLKRYYNIGIGAATPEGLTVFVLKDVDRLGVFELAEQIRALGDKAREGKLSQGEVTGSTFTITSLGVMGGILATPILNYPEVAILGVHKIHKRPVVRNEEIVIRDMAYMSLSFDHRVVDGDVGAEFTQMLVKYLEHPEHILLE